MRLSRFYATKFNFQNEYAAFQEIAAYSKEALNERITLLCGGTPLLYAFDAVSLEDTQRVAYDFLAPSGKFTEVRLEFLPRRDPAGGKKVLHA
ncbi:hypothetical protein J3R82DRAFT_9283 [Butyriboletus roseoflavus]|nr:hypothetical protein J3R82DRAFT_9283 [Butyriboletus roseoflavus]